MITEEQAAAVMRAHAEKAARIGGGSIFIPDPKVQTAVREHIAQGVEMIMTLNGILEQAGYEIRKKG